MTYIWLYIRYIYIITSNESSLCICDIYNIGIPETWTSENDGTYKRFIPYGRRQKTFEFLNRLCLLISNPLPVLNRRPSFSMIQRLGFILLLALLARTLYLLMCVLFIIYLCYIYFILVLYIFFTVTLSSKIYMIQPPVLHSFCFHVIVCMTVNFSRYHVC